MSIQHEPSVLTSVTPAVLLGNHFKALKLPTFAREYEKVAMESAQDRAVYPRYLLRLCELECIDRDRRNISCKFTQHAQALLRAESALPAFPRPRPSILSTLRHSHP